MSTRRPFPRLRARNLQGLGVHVPDAFAGACAVVVIAFRRDHQTLVDSWLPWFERQAAGDPGLRFAEVPVIGRRWAPARPFIDGGMAAAIRDPVVLRRTFTVYGDVTRVTRPLGIADRSTVTVCLVDRTGHVAWQGSGGYTDDGARDLEVALAAVRAG